MLRRSTRWPLLILPGCLLPGCLAPVTSRAQGAEREVMAVVRAVFDGMRSADSATVRPLFHPQARLISVSVRRDTTVVEVEATADGFVQAVARPRTEVWDERISNEKVAIDGPLASVWVDYEFYRDATRNHCGVDHFLLVKEKGTWRIIELADTRRGCS
jgi:hypothetical protein